jgi:hypothetical protein
MQFRVRTRTVTNKQGQEVEKADVLLGSVRIPNTLAISGKLLQEIGVEGADERFNYHVRGSKWVNKDGENRYTVWFNVIGGKGGIKISPFQNFEVKKVAPIIEAAEQYWESIRQAKKAAEQNETNQ